MTTLADKIEALAKRATPGKWELIHYDAGDRSYYDANGPCPGIFSEQEDCGIIHWDGFKQEYWTSANGNQRQIEANARLVVELVNNLPTILRDLRERDQAVEALREIDALDGEINPSNYDHDDACYLNRQFCYAGTIASTTLASIEGTEK